MGTLKDAYEQGDNREGKEFKPVVELYKEYAAYGNVAVDLMDPNVGCCVDYYADVTIELRRMMDNPVLQGLSPEQMRVEYALMQKRLEEKRRKNKEMWQDIEAKSAQIMAYANNPNMKKASLEQRSDIYSSLRDAKDAQAEYERLKAQGKLTPEQQKNYEAMVRGYGEQYKDKALSVGVVLPLAAAFVGTRALQNDSQETFPWTNIVAKKSKSEEKDTIETAFFKNAMSNPQPTANDNYTDLEQWQSEQRIKNAGLIFDKFNKSINNLFPHMSFSQSKSSEKTKEQGTPDIKSAINNAIETIQPAFDATDVTYEDDSTASLPMYSEGETIEDVYVKT